MEPDFHKIFESAPILVMILDTDFYIVAATDAYLAATMTRREDILNKYVFDVFPDNPNDADATGASNLRASLQRVMASRKTDAMAIQKYDIRKPAADGGGFEVRYWSPVNSPILSPDGEVRYIFHKAEDVTDFVKLKDASIAKQAAGQGKESDAEQSEKIRQAQRMEAMGQLAGGVAHDFNNMLTIMQLNCEAGLAHDLPEGARQAISQIQETAARAATMTRQLLAFSRKQVLQPKVLHLNGLIDDIQPMLRRLLPSNIDFIFRPAASAGNIFADAGQIEQILLNLIVNARDAMPSGGAITVTTANQSLDKIAAAGYPKTEPGEYVMLAVSDTGVGMSAETQARIFEPFFTTKALGKGTGLGLATVYGIVSQCAGTIQCRSEMGKGTTFNIYFPLVDRAVRAPQKTTDKLHSLQGNEKILVTEDEEPLRKLIRAALKPQGYIIETAANGSEALEIIAAGVFKPDLLITDVMMPEMTGNTLVARAREYDKKLRILYLSGYAPETLGTFDISEDEPHFLEKPFALAALLSKVREILATP